MLDKQVTIMVLNVDLQCHRCYKKVKKFLCKIPQIQGQEYNEKQNTVTIKVVCCCPEKIKQKIMCKCGDFIQSIEIKIPKTDDKKPGQTKERSSTPTSADKKGKKSDDSKGNTKVTDKPPPPPDTCKPPSPGPLGRTCCRECYEGRPGGPCLHGHGPFRTFCVVCYGGRPVGPCLRGHGPIRTCCGKCYEGRPGGSCLCGHGSYYGYWWKSVQCNCSTTTYGGSDSFSVIPPDESFGSCPIM